MERSRHFATRLVAGLSLAALIACSPDSAEDTAQKATPEPPVPEASEAVPSVQRSPHREAFFGDLHVHTSWSTDAFYYGNRVGPRDAYRFAKGEAIELHNGILTQLETPLDFAAMTDHAEGFGEIEACTHPDNPQYDSEACQKMRDPSESITEYFKGVFERGLARPRRRNPDVCADPEKCIENERSMWQRVQTVADEVNEPGKFTSLIGYEFSGLLPELGMLHRNVIFRGSDVTAHAISALDVTSQADLFSQLDAACQPPCEVITIPHNTNFSWGVTFSRTDEDGSVYSDQDLERRTRIERLVEVTQLKGNSECHFGVGTTDEDCKFGNTLPACAPGESRGCAHKASFVRNALLDGIDLAREGKTNPFKMGMIGSTDNHQSNPGNADARKISRFASAMGDPEAVQRVLDREHPVVGPMRYWIAGGLAAVWAESNTRADIFDALQRREAFATSGSRLRMRFFAGDLPENIGEQSDALRIAYRRAVPMGGDLKSGTTPRFWVWAAKDPKGATLDRVQVVKGWVDGGEQKHRVWDVACSNGRVPGADGRCEKTPATVNPTTCERLDEAGATELQAVFSDSTYRPDEHAFYYVRVLENPSCRWTTWFANSAGVSPPDDVPASVQNRGWSSPIWRQP